VAPERFEVAAVRTAAITKEQIVGSIPTDGTGASKRSDPAQASDLIDRVSASATVATVVRWLLTALLVCGLLLPLALVPIPPILDYPNHLARMFVLAYGPHDPFFSQVYFQHWAIIPNIGIDMIMPHMLAVMPVYTSGRVMLGVTLLLPVLGTVAYSRTVLRVRSLWPLASGLVAYNSLFLMGFMNFLLAVGAALLTAACWIRWRDRRPVAAVAAVSVLTLVIFFAHFFGLLFLGLLICSHELTVLWTRRQTGSLTIRFVARRLAGCAAVFALPILLYLASPLARAGDQPIWGTPAEKLYTLFDPILTYFGRAEVAIAVFVGLVIAVCVSRRRAIVAPQAVLAAVILLLLYPFVPTDMAGASYVDSRLPVMMAFLVFAGFAPRALPRRTALVLTVSFGVIFLLRTALLASVWFGQNQDVADLRRVIAQVAPASRVLVVSLRRPDNIAYWDAMPRRRFAFTMPGFMHLPGLLVIERDSIWPQLFTAATMQPLAVRPAFRNVTMGESLLPDYHALAFDDPPPAFTRDAPYLEDWPSKFDYVLVMAAGGVGDLAALRPDRLELIDRTDIAALMRVRKPQ
jgi:hypothetical protein